MSNNENDLSDNSGNPHIGSNFDDFLQEEGIKEEVEHAAQQKVQQLKAAPQIAITISGPVGRGKTVIIDAIEKLLRDQLDAKHVFVDAHIQQERNAMNLVDYRNQMHEIIQQNVYLLREETVVQTQLNIELDPNDPDPVRTIERTLKGFEYDHEGDVDQSARDIGLPIDKLVTTGNNAPS